MGYGYRDGSKPVGRVSRVAALSAGCGVGFLMRQSLAIEKRGATISRMTTANRREAPLRG